MSYTRILVRRGTSTEWTATNPILATGEFGFETNTGKFKVGNGSSNWTALKYFLNFDDIKSAIVDSAPTALDTLNELALALGEDQNFATTILNYLEDKAPLNSPTFTGTVDMSGATLSGVMLPINWRGAYTMDDMETYAQNDLVTYGGSVYYATGPNVNQSYTPPGTGDWELFASAGETGPTGPTGPTGAIGVTGPTGPQGLAATIEVGNSYYPYEGPEGSFVINTGTSEEAVIDFYLAPGPTGPTGPVGGFESTQTIESGSTRSITSADVGKLITNSAAITITVSNSLAAGQRIDFLQTNAGQITFVAGSGVTLSSKGGKLKTAGQYSAASVLCLASGSYVLIGDLGA
jgi:hypothetical protein